MSIVVIVADVRASPGRRGVPRCLAKMPAQMRLVDESASQRDVAQGRFSLQHVLSGQLDAFLDHEGMRWLSEGAPKGAREMRFAELKERAELRDKHRTCDMTIDIGTHFARLPGEQAPSSVWSRSCDFGINLLTQQRGCFKYRAVNRLFVMKLTSSRIEQRDYVVHPFARSRRTWIRYRQRLFEVTIHYRSLPLHSTSDPTAVDLGSHGRDRRNALVQPVHKSLVGSNGFAGANSPCQARL
jgi:hypothetical protein